MNFSDWRRAVQLAAAAAMIGWGVGASAAPAVVTSHIKVDQFGYLPAMRKVAIVVDPQQGFNAAEQFSPGAGANQYQVRRWADDAVVFSGTLRVWGNGATHAQSGDRGWHFDFSSLTTPGTYYVYDTIRRAGSPKFSIAANVYDEVLKAAGRMYYYQRLGFGKSAPYADARWTDSQAYVGTHQDGQARSRHAKTDPGTARDLSGGWMDAGDSNKYIPTAKSVVLQLLDAYRHNPAVFRDDWNIPESGNGVPDLLDEVKWELDFLRRAQDATGTSGLVLKVGLDTYEGDVTPPSSDRRPRYYVPECTSATISGAAVFAGAGVVYRKLPSLVSYGSDLVARAGRAWVRAVAATENFTRFQTNCDDGDIKAGPADLDAAEQLETAVVAAIYLYEATGKAAYRQFAEANYTRVYPCSLVWWGPYAGWTQAALLRFAGLPGVTASVASSIRQQKSLMNFAVSADDFNAQTDLYRAYIADAEFNWGHNGIRATAGLINLDFVSFGINAAQHATYAEIAQQHLHWLHGANPFSKAMLSNMGALGATWSVNEIFHGWYEDGSVWDNALTSLRGPAPGYLTGGPNKNYSGSLADLRSQPPQKAYRDWNGGWPENSWEISEPSIAYQAAYVALLSRIMVASVPDTEAPSAPTGLAASNIGQSSLVLAWLSARDNVGVTGYDLYRNGVLQSSGNQNVSVAVPGLACGTSYVFTVRARDAAGNASAPGSPLPVTTLPCVTVVYEDALPAAWEDWSWDSTRNFVNTSPVASGSRSIRLALKAWGGLSLRHATGVAPGSLRFSVYAPVAAPLRVYVQTTDDENPSVNYLFTAAARTWQTVVIPRAQLGNPVRIKRVSIQLNSATPVTLYIDRIEIQ